MKYENSSTSNSKTLTLGAVIHAELKLFDVLIKHLQS